MGMRDLRYDQFERVKLTLLTNAQHVDDRGILVNERMTCGRVLTKRIVVVRCGVQCQAASVGNDLSELFENDCLTVE